MLIVRTLPAFSLLSLGIFTVKNYTTKGFDYDGANWARCHIAVFTVVAAEDVYLLFWTPGGAVVRLNLKMDSVNPVIGKFGGGA